MTSYAASVDVGFQVEQPFRRFYVTSIASAAGGAGPLGENRSRQNVQVGERTTLTESIHTNPYRIE